MPRITPLEYYRSKYPYEQLVALLTCNGDMLSDCEFAIEGVTADGGKIYKRYVRASTAAELRAKVSTFTGVKAFHFGAFYDHGVDKQLIRAGESKPVRRVLSFDIDLTDKEFLNTVGEDGKVSAELCDEAYPISAMSAYILRVLLNEAFGYKQVLIVYSGRRGVHVHVFDDAAMRLSDEARSSVLSYVNGEMHDNGLHVRPEVRSIMVVHNLRGEVYRCFDFCVKKLHVLDELSDRIAFVNRLDLLRRDEHAKIGSVLTSLAEDVIDPETGEQAWALIQDKVKSVVFKGVDCEWVLERLDCVVLAYVWPRLDENVTKALGHLTKTPFSCHAASGRVASAMRTDFRSLFKYKPGRDAPSTENWDDAQMEAAVALFRADAPLVDVDMEDVAGPPKPPPQRELGWMPQQAIAKRRRSPLVPTSSARPSWAVNMENRPVPEEKMSAKELQAKKAAELRVEEVEQITDCVLHAACCADDKRRAETHAGMSLASAGQALPTQQVAAWAKHGLIQPTPKHVHTRHDAFGNVITSRIAPPGP